MALYYKLPEGVARFQFCSSLTHELGFSLIRIRENPNSIITKPAVFFTSIQI